MRNLKLTGIFGHEGQSVVSKCPELGVASCGDTVEEAMANLREAVELYLENARKLGLIFPIISTSGHLALGRRIPAP